MGQHLEQMGAAHTTGLPDPLLQKALGHAVLLDRLRRQHFLSWIMQETADFVRIQRAELKGPS